MRCVLGNDVSVSTACSVAETRAITDLPDIAFVDLALPDGDGVDLVHELSRSWPLVPLVVLTVNRAHERVLAALGTRETVFR